MNVIRKRLTVQQVTINNGPMKIAFQFKYLGVVKGDKLNCLSFHTNTVCMCEYGCGFCGINVRLPLHCNDDACWLHIRKKKEKRDRKWKYRFTDLLQLLISFTKTATYKNSHPTQTQNETSPSHAEDLMLHKKAKRKMKKKIIKKQPQKHTFDGTRS